MPQNYGIPISGGDVLTYTGVWPTGLFTSQQTLLQAVSAILQNEPGTTPFVFIRSSAISPTSFGTALSNLTGAPFGITLQLTVDGDFGDAGDVQSLVDNAVYQASGSLPSVSSITAVNGQATGAGSAATAANAQTSSVNVTQSVGEAISGFFSGLGATGTLLSVGVVIVIILILLAVFTPEAVAHSASVFA